MELLNKISGFIGYSPYVPTENDLKDNLYLQSMTDGQKVKFATAIPIDQKSWRRSGDLLTPDIDFEKFNQVYDQSQYSHLKSRIFRKAIALPAACLTVVFIICRLFTIAILHPIVDKTNRRFFVSRSFYLYNDFLRLLGHLVTFCDPQTGLLLLQKASLNRIDLKKIDHIFFKKTLNLLPLYKAQEETQKKSEKECEEVRKKVIEDSPGLYNLLRQRNSTFLNEHLEQLTGKQDLGDLYILELIYRSIEVYTKNNGFCFFKIDPMINFFILKTKLICKIEDKAIRQRLWDLLNIEIKKLEAWKNYDFNGSTERYISAQTSYLITVTRLLYKMSPRELHNFCELNFSKEKAQLIDANDASLRILADIEEEFPRIKRLYEYASPKPSICQETCKSFLIKNPKRLSEAPEKVIIAVDNVTNKYLKNLLLCQNRLKKSVKDNAFKKIPKPLIRRIGIEAHW